METAAGSLKPALGFIRVSTKLQRQGQSPDVQRQMIADYAKRLGYRITEWKDVALRGRDAGKKTHGEIVELGQAGVVEAVFVSMFDRAGRKGKDFIAFADALWDAHVPFYSVMQGKDGPGAARHMWAGMAEEEAKNIGLRSRPAKEASARNGQHHGLTPTGYRREYPTERVTNRYVPGRLVEDAQYAPIVRELFELAAVGYSLRQLAVRLNSDPDCPPTPKGAKWSSDCIHSILRNPVYCGYVRYNAHYTAYYDHSGPFELVRAKGLHKGLVSEELFLKVQERLDAARTHPVRVRLPGPPPPAAGLLRCAECGGPMTSKTRRHGNHAAQYECSHRYLGKEKCNGSGYIANLAHEALLAQVARLRGSPWQPQSLDRVRQADPTADARARLEAELRDTQAKMARHARRLAEMEEDMTAEELAEHRAIGREYHEVIKARREALAALPESGPTDRDLQALHRELAHAQLGDLARELAAIGDDTGLRALLLKLVDSARVVDRAPTFRSRWLRVEVTWVPKVQLLIAAGLLTLAPDVERPDYPDDPVERRRASQRASYHRAKARAS